eukprot:gene5982-6429_t
MSISVVAASVVKGFGIILILKFLSSLLGRKNEEDGDTIDERLKLVTIKGSPIIGSLLHMLPKSFIPSMYNFYKKYYGYNIKLQYLNETTYLITRYDDILEALMKRPKFFHRSFKFNYFNETMGFEYALFNTNGTIWSYMRRFITPSFNTMNVHRHLQDIWLMSNLWVRNIWLNNPKKKISPLKNNKKKNEKEEGDKEGVEVDMTHESMYYTLHVINRVAFGSDVDEKFLKYLYNPQFVKDIQDIMLFGIEGSVFPFPKFLFPYLPYYNKVYSNAVTSNQRLDSIAQQILNSRKLKLGKEDIVQETPAPGSNTTTSTTADSKSVIDILLSKKDTTQVQTELNDEEFEKAIIQNIKVLYLAGGETTSVILSWIIYYLCLSENHDYVERLQKSADQFMKNYSPNIITTTTDELKKILADQSHFLNLPSDISPEELIQKELKDFYFFWKEVTRIAGPAIFLMLNVEKPYRFTSSNSEAPIVNNTYSSSSYDVTCTSFVIQPAEDVFLYLEGLVKDPEVFPNPDLFDPDRWDYEKQQYKDDIQEKMEKYFLSFGFGPRVCPGMQLSMLEAVFAFVTFVFYYDVSLTCKTEKVKRVLGTTAHADQIPILLQLRDERSILS